MFSNKEGIARMHTEGQMATTKIIIGAAMRRRLNQAIWKQPESCRDWPGWQTYSQSNVKYKEITKYLLIDFHHRRMI